MTGAKGGPTLHAGRVVMLAALIPVLWTAAPARADRGPAVSAERRYVRARAADALGDSAVARDGYAAALAATPGDRQLALRAYRQAIVVGDAALARRAAALLDAGNAEPPDATLLLLGDALAAKDWAGARRRVARMQADGAFGFLVPSLTALAALGDRSADPLAVLDAELAKAARDPLAAGYASYARTLLLLALGRTEPAIATIRAGMGATGGGGTRLRVFGAAALVRDGLPDRAAGLISGEDPLLDTARREIARGDRLPEAPRTPAGVLAELLLRMASDLARERQTPLPLGLARTAAFVAPRNDLAWLAVGQYLAAADHDTLATTALDNVDPAGLLADPARTMRLKLQLRRGAKADALAATQAAARRPGAGVDDWTTLGDVAGELGQWPVAADAYARAIALAGAAKAPNDDLASLWLLRGMALERAGDWTAARDALARAGTLAPDRAVILNYLGYAQLERREQLPQAHALIERASRLRPDDASITDSLGWSYYLGGDVPRAIETLSRAAEADPAEPTINEHYGDALWTGGRRFEARYAWAAALLTADEAAASRIRSKLEAGLSATNVAR